MSYDESDDYMDDLISGFHDEFGPQIAEEAIGDFQTDRLRSYFVAHPRLIEISQQQLAKARALLAAGHSDAALVFAVSAMEIALKEALLKPLVCGLVHSDPAAAIIAELIDPRRSLDRFKSQLLAMLSDVVGINVAAYIHTGASKELLHEIQDAQNWRNAIVHRGEQRPAAEAELAVRTAAAVIDTLFPMVVRSLGMHLHGGAAICNKRECRLGP